MNKNNRRLSRARHDSVLEIFDSSGKLIAGIGRLVDFSRTGACFASTATLPAGQKITARLRLLREGSFDVRARIVWARKKTNTTLYGIEFEEVNEVK
jgi:hypothetical protein